MQDPKEEDEYIIEISKEALENYDFIIKNDENEIIYSHSIDDNKDK